MTKILIAEDERDIRDLIVFTLQFGGYEVVATTNGAEAAELAPSEKPDLIMLDVRMPKMTGYEACVALKANQATKDIPVIFLSAKGQESEVNTGLSAGAVAYILKPFAPDHLITKVKEALSKKEAKEAQAAPASAPSAPTPTPASAPPGAQKTPVATASPQATKPELEVAKPEAKPAPVETKPALAEVKPVSQPSKEVKEEKKDEPKAATQAGPTPVIKETKAPEKPVEAKKPKEDKEVEKTNS